MPTNDQVNHPKHYNSHPSGVECITIVRHMNFNVGNVFKYLWRAGLKTEVDVLDPKPEALRNKEQALKDHQKAFFYLKDEIERLEKELNPLKSVNEPRQTVFTGGGHVPPGDQGLQFVQAKEKLPSCEQPVQLSPGSLIRVFPKDGSPSFHVTYSDLDKATQKRIQDAVGPRNGASRTDITTVRGEHLLKNIRIRVRVALQEGNWGLAMYTEFSAEIGRVIDKKCFYNVPTLLVQEIRKTVVKWGKERDRGASDLVKDIVKLFELV